VPAQLEVGLDAVLKGDQPQLAQPVGLGHHDIAV
jgi:hypothetical protein